MGKRRKAKRGSDAPDDYFASGPIEMARFGRLVIGRNRATAEQMDAVRAAMAARFPKVVEQIDHLV